MGKPILIMVAVGMAMATQASRRIIYTAEGDTSVATDSFEFDGLQNGTFLNGVTVGSIAKFGSNAFHFVDTPGVMDTIMLDDTSGAALGSQFSLAAFVKTSRTTLTRLFSSYSGSGSSVGTLIFDFDPDGSSVNGMRFIVNGTSISASSSLSFNDGLYHHLAATYDDGAVKLYLDGSVVGSGTAGSGTADIGANNLQIGEDTGGTVSEQLTGDADDIMVWNTALSAAGIAELAAHGVEQWRLIDIGSNREIFVDYHLIDGLANVDLALQTPTDEGVALRFNDWWEGKFSGYFTLIKDGDLYRLYYRGRDNTACYAYSSDGINWTKPTLGLFPVYGNYDNNVIMDNVEAFTPFIDTKPGIPASERYKAVNPIYDASSSHLEGFVSSNGINWIKAYDSVFDSPVFGLDSQNVAFYSEAEQQYVCYFRDWVDGVRRIARATASNFTNFTYQGLMEYAYYGTNMPPEHHYVNGTFPYFRAPHTYISLAARFIPDEGGQVAPGQVGPLGIDQGYYNANSNNDSYSIFMTTRAGSLVYDRPFPGKYIEPAAEIGPQMARSDFPAWNAVRTGPTEMSFYVGHNYASVSNHLRRYSLRLDGFSALSATNGIGEMVTRPLVFSGDRLHLNYLARPGGSVKVEIQDETGVPISGYALSDAEALTGDDIDAEVRWAGGSGVGGLEGETVRLRFVMDDADLFALRFVPDVLADFTFLSNNTVKVAVDTSVVTPAEYFPSATTNLVTGSWGDVPHSDDGMNSFVVTNFDYSTIDTNGNAVIYLETDDAMEFFRIIME